MLDSKTVNFESNYKEREIPKVKILSSLVGCLKNVQVCLTTLSQQAMASTGIPSYECSKVNRKYLLNV